MAVKPNPSAQFDRWIRRGLSKGQFELPSGQSEPNGQAKRSSRNAQSWAFDSVSGHSASERVWFTALPKTEKSAKTKISKTNKQKIKLNPQKAIQSQRKRMTLHRKVWAIRFLYFLKNIICPLSCTCAKLSAPFSLLYLCKIICPI